MDPCIIQFIPVQFKVGRGWGDAQNESTEISKHKYANSEVWMVLQEKEEDLTWGGLTL